MPSIRSLLAPAIAVVALAACDSSSLQTDLATTTAPDASAAATTIVVTDNKASVDWNLSSSTSVDIWRLYQNELRVCSGEPELVNASDGSYLTGSCTVTLEEGSNSFYVQLCNLNSSGDSICAQSSAEVIDYQPEEQPGAIYLQDIPSSVIENQLALSWIKEEGGNGDYWNIYRNNSLACSDVLVYDADFVSQSGGCDVTLEAGVNQFHAELCVAKPVGIDDICTYSATISTTFSQDPSRVLATPVIVDPDEALPAEYNSSISWNKDSSSGSAGEDWSLTNNGIEVCQGTLASNAISASCGVDLQEGDNLLQVRLCTDVATYSGDSCQSSSIVSVEAFDPTPLSPGSILITNSVLNETYEQSLDVQWQITSGNGVSSWYVDLNGAQQCFTSSLDTYYTSGSCLLDLELGANTISVVGCNYGYESVSECSTSSAVSTERLPLPGTPEITSSLPATTYTSEHQLSWERTSGNSGERWLAMVNDISQCEEELADTTPQSGSCTISLDSGINSVQVRLCVTDSIGTSHCSSSGTEQVELLAAVPATPIISTPAQNISAATILLEWSKSSGENGSYWFVDNNGAEVAACADQPILSSGSSQSGSCDLPLVSGSNIVSVHLCNDNAAGTSSCAASLGVSIVRDILDPQITSASSTSVNENSTSVFYTATASDGDSSAELLSFSISGGDSSFFNFSSSGSLAFAAAADYEQPQGSGGNFYQLTLTVEDEYSLSDQLLLTVEVLNLNDNFPQFATTVLTLSIAENDASVIHTSAASDADGDSLAYSLIGTDANAFSLGSTSGELRFASAPDYETPIDANSDNSYELQIQASDSTNSALQSLLIHVTNSDDTSPQLTSSDSTSLNISEANLDSVIYTATASDPDSSEQFTFSLGGVDANNFDIDASSGELRFTTLPSSANPQDADGDNIYAIDIIISDSAANSSTTSFTVTVVDDIGFPPELAGADSVSIDFAEHSADLVYDANATDPDGDPISYSLAGADASLFDLDSSNGELSFLSAPDYENPFASSTTNVYAVDIIASDGLLTDSQALTIEVQNINEAPYFLEASATSFRLNENNTSSLELAAAIDPDGANVNIVYSLPADAGNGHDYQYFNLLTGPKIAFQDPGADYESYSDNNNDSVYEFIIRASDGSLSADLALTVAIDNIDEAPVFADGSSVITEFEEAGTGVVYTASATDPDQQHAITYSLSGTDADDFSFNASSGELRFDPDPDFEYPEDADQDNIYHVDINASDSLQSASQDLFVKVTDILDTSPGPPTGVAAYGGDGEVRILWNAQEEVDSYTIFRHSDPDDISPTTYSGIYQNLTSGDETITGLNNGSTYYFIIAGTNFFGLGEPSEPVSAQARLFVTACPYPNSASATQDDTSAAGALDCSCSAGATVNAWLGMESNVSYSCSSTERTIASNSIPDHATGIFPNADNPNAVAAVAASYSHPLDPTFINDVDVWVQVPGVARNGVKFEPETGETTTGKGSSVWRYEAINGGVLELGLDDSHAHVQPDGSYHYHGMPEGHMDLITVNDGYSMVLVGWAADGYPIYGRYGYTDPLDARSDIKVIEGSYELLELSHLEQLGRPSSDSGRGIDSLPVGTFVEDWAYAAGSGDLDVCNGRYGVTPHFPDGIYHYYVTDDYPYVQRCLKGSQELEFTSASGLVEVNENVATVYKANATNNLGSVVTYSLNAVNSSDNALFSINSANGDITFIDGAPNYEALPTGPLGRDPYTTPYLIEIDAHDDVGGAASIQVQLMIIDIDESPYFISGETNTLANGNAGSIDTRIANEIEQEADGVDVPFFAGFSPWPKFADDEDEINGLGLLYDAKLTGADAEHFYLNSTYFHSGDVGISFVRTPDEDDPQDADGDNIYEFNLVAIDSSGNETTKSLVTEVSRGNDEYPYMFSSVSPSYADSANDDRLYLVSNLDEYSTSVFFTVEGYDEDLNTDASGATSDLLQNQTQLYFEFAGSAPDEQYFQIDIETGEVSATHPLSYDTPQDANQDGVYELQIIVSDYNPYGSQAELDRLLDSSFYPEDVKPQWLYVTVDDVANQLTEAAASGPQIPWFFSDVDPGDSVKIPWVIYSGPGATSWEIFVDGAAQCSGVGGDNASDVVDRGVCEVRGSDLTAGKFDHWTHVEVCYADGSCEASDPVVFGYAASEAITFPDDPNEALLYIEYKPEYCQDVDIGDEVSATSNYNCYQYLLQDDDFGGPYDEIPTYLTSDYGRSFDVIAYYTEWGIYARDVQPADMPVNLLSTALYSFIQFEDDNKSSECEECVFTGDVDLADYYAALQKTYPTDKYIGTEGIDANDGEGIGKHWTHDSGYKGNGIFKQFWLLKQKFPHFKTCLSVGGWTFSRPFPLVSEDYTMRRAFAKSIVDMAVKYHFDCIDIDWEFPGRAGGDNVVTDPETGLATYNMDLDDNATFLDPSVENDPRYFELLVSALYDEIKSRVESYYIEINSAVYTSSEGMAIMDYAAFSHELNGIHMMTYDYYGAWDPFTGFQAALYPNADPVSSDVALAGYGGLYNPEHNIASAMARGVNNAMDNNFSGTNYEMRRKVVPGLAFYGRNYSEVGHEAGGNDPVPGQHMVRSFGSAADKGNTAQISWEPGNINYIQLQGYFDDGEFVEGNEDYNATPEMVVGQDEDGNDILEVVTFNTADYNWTYHWDDEAKAPFLFDPDGLSVEGFPTGSFITYSDPRTIFYQTCHAAWENSKGVMFWEITQDSTDFQLVDAIHAAIRGEDLANRGYETAPSCRDISGSEHYGGGTTHVGDSDQPGIAGLTEMGYIDTYIFDELFPHRNNDPSGTAADADTYTWNGFFTAASNFTEAGFLNVGSKEDRVRELAAFLANTSHETGNSTGGFQLNNIGGEIGVNTRYDGGYYYQQEQYCAQGGSGYGSNACRYCDEYHADYGYICYTLYDSSGNALADYFFYGRGPLQLSWSYNYGPFSEYYYNGDADILLYDPNMMLEDSEVAFASAMWFWMTARDNKPSAHQVMTDPNYFGDQDYGHFPGFGMTINIINGGLECGSAFNYDKVRNRVGYYLTYLNIFSEKQGGVGIAPWVNGFGSNPATSLDFPDHDEHLIDDDYPDARDLLSCSQMVNYNDIQ